MSGAKIDQFMIWVAVVTAGIQLLAERWLLAGLWLLIASLYWELWDIKRSRR